MNATDVGLQQRAQALGQAIDELEHWLAAPEIYPIATPDREAIDKALVDLGARVRQLQSEPALLTVVLVGGTGVGKSTLLNALAGDRVAESSIARPTTMRPTVYHHRDVPLDRLDPAFQKCKAVAHDRKDLRYKILMDTPDLDGSVIENRERLREVLPVADVVVYVGSQEKYHDQEAWKLLLAERGARGFAFVLNKWDRCQIATREATGRSPDVDFRQSLKQAGFDDPLLFRTSASTWLQSRLNAAGGATPKDDFLDFERWLEAGLDARMIRWIKTRGVVGLLDELITPLERSIPPDWSSKRDRLRRQWDDALRDAVAGQTDLLVEAADHLAGPLERHFSRLGRTNFGGAFGYYLKLVDVVKRLSVSIAPSLGKSADPSMEELARKAVASIPSESNRHRRQSMHDRLLALADHDGWPIGPLDEQLPGETSGQLTDKDLAAALAGQLTGLEKDLVDPTGGKAATRAVVRLACEWGPVVAVSALGVKWLWDHVTGDFWGFTFYIASLILIALVFAGLHFALSRLVPIQWELLRPRFRRMVEDRLLEHVAPAYYRGLDRFTEQVNRRRRESRAALDVFRAGRDQLRAAEQASAADPLFARAAR